MLPVLASVGLSFFDYDMLSAPKWAGLGNYLRMIVGDEVFPKTVINTLKFAIVTGPVSFFLSFLLAWFINEFKSGLRHILAFLFYAPSLAGNAYFVWQVAFSGDSYGYVNAIGMQLGLINTPKQWFSDPALMKTAIIVVVLWSSLGVGFLSFIAGLQNVDRSLYEAAAIDGIKNRYQELWYVTLPSMKGQLLFSAIMSITSSFSIGDIVTQLCGFPSASYAAHTIMNHLSDYGSIRYEMGYACAIATVLFLMMAGTNALVQKLLSKVGG